jgi:hypothetical protein
MTNLFLPMDVILKICKDGSKKSSNSANYKKIKAIFNRNGFAAL